jgi:tripartite-type tricarboxylate transporter receptor subunit TctC
MATAFSIASLLPGASMSPGAMSPGGGARAADFDAAKHFKGQTMRLVVDFKPGGGTDIQARYFSRFWGKFVPNRSPMG